MENKHGLLWRDEASFWLKIWKRSEEYSFLKEAPSQTLQQTIAHQLKLARLQRKLAKKTKFSNNWRKIKQKIARVHTKIANIRKDFLHKLSTTISKNHAMVAVEDLKVSNMSRSVKGTIDKPGSNVKSKSGLNKSIPDQGWSMFVDMLEYKLDWNGGILVKVDPKYTSQQCPECQHTSKENRQTQSHFECVSCGYSNNADKVGAINILERGHSLLASGAGTLVPALNEEPSIRLVA